MSKERFRLTVEDWQEVHRLPGSWPVERLRAVLEQAEFDDEVEDADVLDMAVLVLQDLDVQEAGELVLEVVFGDQMSPGVRQNLVDDLEDDRPWEQFASVALQSGIFEAMVLLQQVFPNRYGIPDAVCLRLRVEALDKAAATYLEECSGTDGAGLKSLLLRLLAGGMPEEAVLNRLYADELRSDRMPEAAHLLWILQGPVDAPDSQSGTSTFEIHSSWQWLGPLEEVESWEASGWPDGARSGL
jgi:hypothetical protein